MPTPTLTARLHHHLVARLAPSAITMDAPSADRNPLHAPLRCHRQRPPRSLDYV